MTREELVLHGGEEINMVGDGFLAGFDSPTRAIRCGLAIVTSDADTRDRDPRRRAHR